MGKTRIIFICTGNSARSQMAEAILRKYAGEHFEVHSAGTKPKGIHPQTITVMKEAGYDLSNHLSKSLSQFLGKVHFGIGITVCAKAEAECPILLGVGTRLHWPFDDPAAFEGPEDEQIAKFREIRDQIEEKIKAWLRERNIITN